MGLYHIFLVLFALLFTQLCESRLTHETFKNAFKNNPSNSNVDNDDGTIWAVLVAGSKSYKNYRHQADICHAYQILKRGGLSDENIIVFMYDDIAYDQQNPRQGTIINNPNGQDVYQGVPKDYTGENLTANNLLNAILGDQTAITGGTEKVVNSGPNDRIFIYYADHGGPGILSMPNGDDIYAQDFISTLEKKYQMGTYKTMVVYVEACESGSIFDGLLSNGMNIYVTTAANPSESSYSTYCPGDSGVPSEFQTCLGDLYSVSWMEDSDMHDSRSETLANQYQVVKERTAEGGSRASHVMQYGDNELGGDPLSLYIGSSSPNSFINIDKNNDTLHNTRSYVDQHEADIIYLKQKVLRAPKGSMEREEAQKKLEATLTHRAHIDSTFQMMGKALFGDQKGHDMIKTVRSAGKPIVDDWDCFKNLVGTYKTHCGQLSTYGKKHMRAFANMCNAGVQQAQLAKVLSQVCVNKLN
ncbi:unnamed protein product [Amaranthus hypochondriacus]